MSSLHFVIGRLLIKFSISQNDVIKISSVRHRLRPRTATITWRTVRMCRSHTPPWWEAYGGLNTHSTSFWRAARMILLRSSCFILLDISDLAPTMFVPLSDQTLFGNPRLAAKHKRAFMKESASIVCNTPRCIARVEKHVKMTPYRFAWDWPTRT